MPTTCVNWLAACPAGLLALISLILSHEPASCCPVVKHYCGGRVRAV
jgi:hypothetical protein